MDSEKHSLQLQKVMMEAIPSYMDSYWSTHFTFEKRDAKKKKLSLIGENLKREILINAFLPLLYSTLQEDLSSETLQKFDFFYESFKSQSKSKADYLKQRFFANSSKGDLLKSTQIELGAYQLHKDFCMHFESSCEGCPFVERMQMQQIDLTGTLNFR